ncbi:MAG: hypothetical protein EOO87_21165 [Pedobacter sp.]|nr:MAG: hypothetical protein EOO87_21165 [Pedobacter sp.]
MPKDYSAAVLADYEKKKKDGSLSPNLLDPKAGDFREDCLSVYRKRPKKEDEEILNLFFRTEIPQNGYYSFLEQTYAHQYKQLPKILAGKVSNAGLRYFELLAWLIDFQPRPSTAYYKSIYNDGNRTDDKVGDVDSLKSIEDKTKIEDKEKDFVLQDESSNENNEETTKITVVHKNPLISKKYYKTIGAFLGVFFVLIAAYIFSPKNLQCMYWTGDHYEPIACDQKVSASVIALDTFSVSHLKKISKRDTITTASIGKVHYTKVKIDSVDFYTTKGDHPTNSTKRLLPMTQYILDKYIPHHR